MNAKIECKNWFCHDGFVKFNILENIGKENDSKKIKNNISNISFNKDKSNENNPALSTVVTGKISNLGYIFDGFGVYDKISDGNVSFNLKLSDNLLNKIKLKGNFKLEDSMTIYNSAKVKNLEQDSLFLKIKDQIFSNNKIIINFADADFSIENNILKIESLVANNYKIGFTANGFIDILNGSIDLSGMIIPAFVINNLFGIGNIPIIGSVINKTLITDKGGGLFGIKYSYSEDKYGKSSFETNKISAFIPTTIKSLFNKN